MVIRVSLHSSIPVAILTDVDSNRSQYTFGSTTCAVTIVDHQQNSHSVLPNAVKRNMDLTISGTTDANSDQVKCEFLLGANRYEPTVIAPRGMNWSFVIPAAQVGNAAAEAVVIIRKPCSGGSPAIAMEILTIIN